MTPGKLEMVIKINALPEGATTNAHGWRTFSIDCEGTRVTVTVRPKMWAKLEEAAKSWPSWVAAIAGKLGEKTAEGFVLAEPSIQVFERKPKAEPAPTAG